jgi:hypothetical protein
MTTNISKWSETSWNVVFRIMRDDNSYRTIKNLSGIFNAALPSGLNKPLGLRFVVEVRPL